MFVIIRKEANSENLERLVGAVQEAEEIGAGRGWGPGMKTKPLTRSYLFALTYVT